MLGPIPSMASIGVKASPSGSTSDGRGSPAGKSVAAAVPESVRPDQAAAPAVEAAARSHYAGRDVQVTGFRDAASGHYVLRVADRQTGEVLHQSPPDALLRFFAAARQQSAAPLLRLEA